MFFFFFFFWLVAKIYLSGPGQSGSNIVAWFCGMVDFRGNTISIRFSYFGNPNWTKKPSGNFFVSFDFCLFVFGGSGEWKTRRVRFFECVSYIFFFYIFFSVRHSARAHFDCWADKDRDGIRRILLAERVSGEGRTSDRVREREKRKKITRMRNNKF
jgi:hypothetical protein